MLIIIESVILCICFTLAILAISQNPIATLYNYPPKIQERVKSLEIYAGQIPTRGNKILMKTLGFVIAVLLISLILRYINGCDSFQEGFGYGLLLWTILNLYDMLVIDFCWFCRSPKFILKGTEDMTAEYRNYRFHAIESLKGEGVAVLVCTAAGLLVEFL